MDDQKHLIDYRMPLTASIFIITLRPLLAQAVECIKTVRHMEAVCVLESALNSEEMTEIDHSIITLVEDKPCS